MMSFLISKVTGQVCSNTQTMKHEHTTFFYNIAGTSVM